MYKIREYYWGKKLNNIIIATIINIILLLLCLCLSELSVILNYL